MVKGFLKDRNFFSATKILAKHDENYMPPEVAKMLNKIDVLNNAELNNIIFSSNLYRWMFAFL